METDRIKILAILVCCFAFVQCVLANDLTRLPVPHITLQAMPDGEIQPELLRDKQGRVHLIFFKIDDIKSRMGHLFYKQYQLENSSWSEAIQISQNSYRQPDVIATAKLAVDGAGRVHVTWLGQSPTAYLYSRSDPLVQAFSAPRSMVTQYISGAEASAVISAHQNKVTLTWMAGSNENKRTVYSMTSNDHGITFGEEVMIGDQVIGGCACCGYASDYNNAGDLLVAYRSAQNGQERHMQLLSMSGDQKKTQLIDEWMYSSCPVSTNDLVHDNKGAAWVAWETAGEIYAAQVKDKAIKAFNVKDAQHKYRQKHPAIAINKSQFKLLAWSEGNGYFSGGELKLQVYDPEFKVIDSPSTAGMHPAAFSRVAVSSLDDNSFLVLY